MMPSSPDSPPKRPRLSLQIKAMSNGSSGRTSRTLATAVNPTSPTAFNTLSNVYMTAIGKSSTPITSEPLTAIDTSAGAAGSSSSSRLPVLKIQTSGPQVHATQQYSTPAMFPETPLTAQPRSPAVYQEIRFPSTMTATPPLSAGPVETAIDNRVFSFSSEHTMAARLAAAESSNSSAGGVRTPAPMSPRTPRRRATATGSRAGSAPYTHPRSLHSILRNSPLPRLRVTGSSPVSPRRQSLRLREKAARRVEYDSPLEQTITTNKYTKSHIDLLCEEASNSPYSPSAPLTPVASVAAAAAAGGSAVEEKETTVLDLAMAYSGDETRDGGQTPGPFEEMRRRMASLAATSPLSSPSSGGIRKRKKREKKRRWVWTIGVEDDEGDEVGGAVAAARAAEAAAAGHPLTATPAAAEVPAAAPNATITPTAAPVVLAATPRPRSKSAGAKLAVVTAALTAAANAAAGAPTTMPSTSTSAASAHRQPSLKEPLTAVPRLCIDTAGFGSSERTSQPEEITPSVESSDLSQGWSASDAMDIDADVDMSDVSSVDSDFAGPSRGLGANYVYGEDTDMITPTVPRKQLPSFSRLGSEDLVAQEGTRRDTPIPSDLVCP